jgi:hypothetical protein
MRLIALTLLLAQEGLPSVPPRMPVDEEASAFACSFAQALRGIPCAYEASSAPADPLDNAAAAAEAAREACKEAAQTDAGLRRDCERSVVQASASERCAIHSRLADARGRLTPDAQACAELLREEISRTARAALVSLGCCACLSESRCPVSASQCKRELADLAPSAALRSCLSKSCSQSCSFAVPARTAPDETPAAAPPPEDARYPRKI